LQEGNAKTNFRMAESKKAFNKIRHNSSYQIPFKHDVDRYQDYERNSTCISPFS
jgi:hypothetical protein